MESGNVDTDRGLGKPLNGSSEPVATYKSIAEDIPVAINETPEKFIENTAMAKQNGDSEINDGAQERMLKASDKIGANDDTVEVKFVAENGDAKIDIEAVRQVFAGMGKEELMKFANDPFWVRLRWFMFIAFWLLWAAMLGGAIAIIIMAPKCTAPVPKLWWEESPLVEVDLKEIGSLEKVGPILEELQTKKIQAIILTSIIRSSSPGHTENFTDVQPEFGTINDFKKLIAAAKKSSQHIVLEVDPNHTSDNHTWFKLSITQDPKYKDYYIWANATGASESTQSPPNDWTRSNGQSMWTWNTVRRQYYLHQFEHTQPDLNYHNKNVVNEFSGILKYWLDLGVGGFILKNTQYLTEDATLKSALMRSSVIYTQDSNENKDVLQIWKSTVFNNTSKTGLFTVRGNIPTATLQVLNDKKTNATIVDLPEAGQSLTNAFSNATAIRETVSKILSQTSWPAWRINNNKTLNLDEFESLTLMTMLLPGTPILAYNQTKYVGLADLMEARHISSFLYGSHETDVLNGTVFVYSRLKSGNPGYLVLYQTGSHSGTVDLSKLQQVSEEVSVVAFSSNYRQNNVVKKSTLPSNAVPISPKSTLILTFVPKDSTE